MCVDHFYHLQILPTQMKLALSSSAAYVKIDANTNVKNLILSNSVVSFPLIPLDGYLKTAVKEKRTSYPRYYMAMMCVLL